jgi:hypothetical protein
MCLLSLSYFSVAYVMISGFTNLTSGIGAKVKEVIKKSVRALN